MIYPLPLLPLNSACRRCVWANAELQREPRQSTAYKPYETRRHVGRSLFEWVSTSRLPLNSQEVRTDTELE